MDKEGAVSRRLRAIYGSGLAVAVLLTTVGAAWFRAAPSKQKTLELGSFEAGLPGWLPASSQLAAVRRPGPLAHTSVLLDDTLEFFRSRHRTSSHTVLYNNRLPRKVLPEHYDIEIRPRFVEKVDDNTKMRTPPGLEAGDTAGAFAGDDDDTFSATVAVRVLCVEATDLVVMHAGKFNYTNGTSTRPEAAVQVWDAATPLLSIPVTSVEKGNDDTLIIRPSKELERGKRYVIQIQFAGRLGDTRGFYKYHYNLGNLKQHLLVTFFEPTFAREAIPCFDEPDMKATFTVVVVRPRSYHSISTMPLARSEDRPDGSVADHFMTTTKMSTYTLAFMISNYSSTRNGKVSVWTRPDETGYANYAAEITPLMIEYFEQLLDVPYALPKIDLVALPSFLVDAMENWGLLTFHKNSLLYNEGSDGASHKTAIATVIAHELAHQWFGNLVTMRWWNDVWLNEGFASYMQYLGVDAVHPEWKIMNQFPVTDMMPIMKAEYNSDSHPLSVDTNFPTELDSLFDRIVYNKGPAIVRMMSYFLTPPVFIKGIRAYLKKYSFGNANQDELFEELTKAQPEGPNTVNVKEVMDTWTKQAGYPVIDVVRNYEERTASITQRHHCVRPDQARIWIIPVTYTDARSNNFNDTSNVLWMKSREATLRNLPDRKSWIILNLQSSGYYKVNYDTENWALLRSQLVTEPEAIPVLNRAQLIQDANDLAHSGDLSYSVAMDILDYVRRETAYAPLKSSLNTVDELDTRLRATDFYAKWQTYMKNQLQVHYDRLHWEDATNESMSQKLIRKDVVFWACQFNYQPCLDNCVRTFQDFMNNSRSLKRSLQRDLTGTLVTLCHGIRLGDNTDWRFLVDHIRDASNSEQAHVIVSALGCTKETNNIRSLLSFSMRNMTAINKNMGDATGYFFESAAYSNKGSDITLQFFMDNWKTLLDKYGKSPSLRDTIWFAIQGIRKSEDIKRMEHFFADNVQSKKAPKKLTRTFQTALDLARSNINWVLKNGHVIEKWLDSKLAKSDMPSVAAA
ncbi:aminopeptidase Ey-like [Haemaphysalis longicornis]